MAEMMVNVAIITAGSSLRTLFLAMTMHPEWQGRVYEEIYSVVGDERVVELTDSPRLPTLRAVIKDCFRWRPTILTVRITHHLRRYDPGL
jgi:cytochrome P450